MQSVKRPKKRRQKVVESRFLLLEREDIEELIEIIEASGERVPIISRLRAALVTLDEQRLHGLTARVNADSFFKE